MKKESLMTTFTDEDKELIKEIKERIGSLERPRQY